MNAAHHLLDDLAMIGATIAPAGDRLILRAGPTAIPAVLVNRLREAKGELIATLDRGPTREGQADAGKSARHQFRHRKFEGRIIEWLNDHPAPSTPGHCAWCARTESSSAVVLPFGTVPGTHTWLHAECWAAWQGARRAHAVDALRLMGVISPPID